MIDSDLKNDLIQKVKRSRKYRDLDLPDAFLTSLLEDSAAHSQNPSATEKIFREKLHNVVAPYLETISYPIALRQLDTIDSEPEMRKFCLDMLNKHASSRERLPNLTDFYNVIWERIGSPNSILDLACALNPLSLPWMSLPPTVSYAAYDIHKPRVDFLGSFFNRFYPNAQAIQQDILASPPVQTADCAFFFKEAHRFEKRRPGSNREFFDKLNVKTIVVSLPASDLTGHHSLEDYHKGIIENAITQKPWQLDTAQVGNELLFFIRKS